MYHEHVYYHMVCSQPAILNEFKNKLHQIGDVAYMIDNELYVDDSGFCNISLFDSENIFIVK